MDKPEHLLACQCKLGEGPLWHMEEQALYWVDLYRSQVQRFEPITRRHDIFPLAGMAITALGLRGSGGFVCAAGRGLGFWSPGAGDPVLAAEPEAGIPNHRFNDGAVDRQGRFWAGSMYDGPVREQPNDGRLYRFDPDRSLQVMETGVFISNGIGWSADGRVMYYTDSHLKTIYAYDCDPQSGRIANRRRFIHTPDEPGVPDGLTVDAQGFLWSARWGGWKIQRYDPDGVLEREIPVPVEYPTSCAFGGPELADLYITSAWIALDPAGREAQPMAGDLFRLHTDFSGLPASAFAG